MILCKYQSMSLIWNNIILHKKATLTLNENRSGNTYKKLFFYYAFFKEINHILNLATF